MISFLKTRTFNEIYIVAVGLSVLAVSALFQEAQAVLAGGGAIRVSLMAVCLATFAVTYHAASFWLILLIIFGEPVMGKSSMTSYEYGMLTYYTCAAVVLIGPMAALVFTNRR